VGCSDALRTLRVVLGEGGALIATNCDPREYINGLLAIFFLHAHCACESLSAVILRPAPHRGSHVRHGLTDVRLNWLRVVALQ
jgi:hypothetical protein